MSVYKRGQTYWYKFLFQGQLIRESAKTNSKTVAREAERARRRELELAINRIPRRDRMPLFSVAAREWLDTKAVLAAKTVAAYRQYVKSLTKYFGDRLVCDIGLPEIAKLQRERKAAGLSARTINYEVHTLRGILKHFSLWSTIADQVRPMKGERQPGRALSREEESRLLAAIRRSSSPVLLPLFVVSVDSGLRASEVRALKRVNINARWSNGQIVEAEIVVPKSKTEAGTGRVVPLTNRAREAITDWLKLLGQAGPDAFLFPHHTVGFSRGGKGTSMRDVDLGRPIGEWKGAWRRALKTAGVKARWHDLRHTLVSRLAENPAVSEETIRALAGHVSRTMLARYSHIRAEAKRAAILALEYSESLKETSNSGVDSAEASESSASRAQNWAQSGNGEKR
jgi:integrase